MMYPIRIQIRQVRKFKEGCAGNEFLFCQNGVNVVIGLRHGGLYSIETCYKFNELLIELDILLLSNADVARQSVIRLYSDHSNDG